MDWMNMIVPERVLNFFTFSMERAGGGGFFIKAPIFPSFRKGQTFWIFGNKVTNAFLWLQMVWDMWLMLGRYSVGMAQPFIIPIDLPPGKPAPREHFLLEPTVGLHMWKYSQDMEFRGFCGKCENIPRE